MAVEHHLPYTTDAGGSGLRRDARASDSGFKTALVELAPTLWFYSLLRHA